jgi:hypothetical protein
MKYILSQLSHSTLPTTTTATTLNIRNKAVIHFSPYRSSLAQIALQYFAQLLSNTAVS